MSLDADIALLSGACPISALSNDALRLLAFAADTRMLREGDILFRKGERADGAFLLRKGRIALQSENGKPFIAMPGTLIGRAGLFAKSVRPVTAKALEASSVMRLPASLMRRVCEEFPQAAPRMREALREDLNDLMLGLGRVRLMMQG